MRNNATKRLLAAALCLCMLLSLYVPSVSADIEDYDSLSFGQLLNIQDNLTWVVAGDSITHNGGWSQGTNSYGEWLEQYLRDIGRTDSVVLTGVGGATLQDYQPDATSRNGISVGTDDFITKYNPDVVTIKLGMNNRPLDEATFKNLYVTMLDAVYADAAKNGKVPKVVILTPSPLAGENNDDLDVPGQDSVNRMVGWLSSIAADYNAKNGKHIEFVDLRNAFTNERLVLGDEYFQTFFYGPSDGAIHPNAAGQYLIFKTIAKTLGFYDASMPIFNHDYADLNEGYMYVDSTYISDYTGDYGAEANGPSDEEEMDKTIPALEMTTQPELIASIDFTDKNGSFAGGATYAGATRIDMTDAEVMDDALTLEEAKALGTEFSVIFRARLDPSNNKNQPVLFVSATGSANWNNAISLGVQGKDDQMYYEIRSNNSELTSSSNTFTIDSTKTVVNGGWHTIAIVQSADSFSYYVDGALVATKAFKLNEGKTIGAVFANATDFVAHIGSYGENAGSYQLDGDLDYYQLYNGALSAEEVAYLTAGDGIKRVDADEMNKTMPALDGVSTVASIEFTSSTGSFDGANTNLVDLTDAAVAADPITFAEAQALGKSFSVVLRGRLEQGTNANAGILLISNNGVAKWNDALTVGIPSQKNQGWLRLMNGGSQMVNPNGQYNFTGTTPSGDGEWHTLVITVSENAYTYYLDGGLVDTRTLTFTSGIGEVMTNANSFAARFGRYSDGDGGSYTLKGVLDYFQFYGQTLTAAQAAQLSVNNAEQMNATMPTLPEAEKAASVLASADFGSSNGKFGGDSGELRYVDLMNDEVVTDKLTAEEVKAMGKEYTIVFRARMEDFDFDFANHNVTLYMSDNKDAGWGPANTLMVGFPGKHSKNIWYGEKTLTSVSGTVAVESLRAAVMDGKWHTFAIVQAEDGMTMYVDGASYSVSTNWYLQQELGTYFADAVDNGTFEAIFGSYGSGSNADAGYGFDGWVDYVQLYDGVLTANNIKALADANAAEVDPNAAQWSDIDTDNAVWAIAGGQQMLGYQGSVGNRSLLRLIENTARNGSGWINRDIRILPFVSAGYDPEYLADNYDAIFGGHNYNVFMLLPEVPDVYAAGYVHSADLVAAYKQDIEALMTANSSKVKVLWTPLASNNDTINAYINDYAAAVRQIASKDNTILFFDSNKFMNERMAANSSLKTNWFEEGMNISPLCALDVTCAFYAHANVASLLVSQEMKHHNLRLSSDNRPLKDSVRDYIVPGVSVSGSSITVDASNILAAYPGLSNLRVAVLSATGVGSNHDGNWEDIAYFGSGSSVTFTAPWSNAVVTVIGDMNGYSYRFKDVSTSVAAPTLTVEHYTDGLTGLEVVGAPAIGFSADKTSYDVELYQYQRNVQILAQGGDNLSVTVNGKSVEVGELSQQIAVNGTATVEVKVTGGSADKTYTLNLTRPDSADIIITEVMHSTSGALYDMVEIYNASGEELNLLDYALGYKKDYTDSVYTTQNKGMYPYYFTGDDQAFNSRNGSTQTYTGINQITKNSTFWSGEDVVTEPDYIPFPADSTMVLWVKYSGASATYETLISTLENSATTYTLEDGTKIVPNADIVALAERPNGITTNGAVQTGYGVLPPAVTNFYLDDFNALTKSGGDDNSSRGWIFILKDTAVRDDNVSITEAGDDIISASMMVRPTNSVNMSTVLYYDTDRGMAVARNPVSFNSTEAGAPYYSSEYSYANYTTFGAVEYWQKPYDLADTAPAVIDNQTPAGVISGEDAQIKLNITDNQDIRYLELYVDADNDGTYETVIKKDITLITSATNEGVAKDVTSYTQTFDLTGLTNTVNYYGFVLDGNNNKTELGTAATPKTIEMAQPGQLKINASVLDEAGNASAEKITVTITLNQGDATVGFAGNYVVYNAQGESVGTITNGTGTLTVGNGDVLIVNNLPEGTGYTLTVTVPEGYEDLTKTEDLTGKIGTDGVTNVAAQKAGALIPGDVNGDGVVSDADVELLLWHTLFGDMYPISGNADFNGDGMVNDADVEHLLWHTLFPDTYPL